jgi:hypothetical protein
MKTLIDKMIANGAYPQAAAIETYVLTHTDFHYWGNFKNNKDAVILTVDYPMDALVNPTWNTLIVSYEDMEEEKSDHVLVARLVLANRLTGKKVPIAVFDSNKNRAIGSKEGLVMFNVEFDFYENAYFIELQLLEAKVNDVSTITYRISLVNVHKG